MNNQIPKNGLMTNHTSPIEIWDSHTPISIDRMRIIVDNSRRCPLPNEVESRVKRNWKRFQQTRPNSVDRDTAFLTHYTRTPNEVFAEVFMAPYSYNQYLNRDDTTMKDTAVCNSLNYNPLASWIIVITKDNYALFGIRKGSYADKIDGFGGFIHTEDLKESIAEGRTEVDVKYYSERKLKEEIGKLSSRVADISLMGLDFNPLVGPKGFDGMYVTLLDGNATEMQRRFRENEHMSKELISVPANPKSLLNFISTNETNILTSFISGIFTYISSKWGRNEMKAMLQSYAHKGLIRIHDSPPSGEVKRMVEVAYIR